VVGRPLRGEAKTSLTSMQSVVSGEVDGTVIAE
jgi:hypothetical protein